MFLLFLQAISVKGLKTTLQTDYILKVVCLVTSPEFNLISSLSVSWWNFVSLWYMAHYPRVLQILGLDMCVNTLVGDPIRRGISGGQKKRLTIGDVTYHTKFL